MYMVMELFILPVQKSCWMHQGNGILIRLTKTLSLILPSGKSLETCIIEMKKRLWTVDLSECSNVQIINIDMIGAPVNLNNATGCTITDCNIKHFYSSFGVNETMGIARNSGIIMVVGESDY